MSDPSPETPSTYRETRAAEAKANKEAKAKRRAAILEAVADGLDNVEIARSQKLDVRTVRREIDRALAERPLQAPENYVRLQVQRLNKAMRAIADALDQGDLKAAKPLLAVLDKLDRYHRYAALADQAPAPAAAAPLALTHSPGAPIMEAPARTEVCA